MQQHDPRMTAAHINAQNEHRERLRKRRRLPQPVPVISSAMRSPASSLVYPTAKNIAACSNPAVQATATRLLQLDTACRRELREKQIRAIARHSAPASSVNNTNSNNSSSGTLQATGSAGVANPEMAQHVSEAQRAEAFERLTHRSIADEARAHSKIEDAKPRTFHDHLAPVAGCNDRLYSADPKIRHRDVPPAAITPSSKKPVVRPAAYWGQRFSDDAVKRHQFIMDGLIRSAISTSPTKNVSGNDNTDTSVDIEQIVKRLASPMPSRRAQSATPGSSTAMKPSKQRVPSADVLRSHVERFYIKGLEKEREVSAALDLQYKIHTAAT